MKFDTLVESTKSEKNYAQLFVHYEGDACSIGSVVTLVERQGGHIKSVEIFDSEETDYKIAYFKLYNTSIKNIVIGLNENGFYDVQGVNRLSIG